jgi:hypothetical protein
VLVHGEPAAQAILADLLREAAICRDVRVPALKERLRLDA